MGEDKFLCYIWDFKKPMKNIMKYLKENFPELIPRLASAWKISETRWEIKFKKVNKDEL